MENNAYRVHSRGVLWVDKVEGGRMDRDEWNRNIVASFARLAVQPTPEISGAPKHSEDGMVRAVILLVGRAPTGPWRAAEQVGQRNPVFDSAVMPQYVCCCKGRSVSPGGSTGYNTCTERTPRDCLVDGLLLSL